MMYNMYVEKTCEKKLHLTATTPLTVTSRQGVPKNTKYAVCGCSEDAGCSTLL